MLRPEVLLLKSLLHFHKKQTSWPGIKLFEDNTIVLKRDKAHLWKW